MGGYDKETARILAYATFKELESDFFYSNHLKLIYKNIINVRHIQHEYKIGLLIGLKENYLDFITNPLDNTAQSIQRKSLFENVIKYIDEKIVFLISNPDTLDGENITSSINNEVEFIESNDIEENIKETSELDIETKDNDYIKSTIEDYIFPFKKFFLPEKSYDDLVEYLYEYFSKGSFPKEVNTIRITNVNVKSFGWALNSLYKGLKINKEKLSFEYLSFGKQNISIFKNVELTETNMNKCNLYKYYTQKPVNNR